MPLSNPRINWIEIVGFRAFGATPQRITFESNLACIWGANSQGKTSLAEAFEFVLTGTITRRSLIGSSVDEFADSLRNAHLPPDVPTSVTLQFVDADGSDHTVQRTLDRDYGRRNDCESSLVIDGNPAAPGTLQALGIAAMSGPASGHVLLQHTLTYLLSARPIDRATFFKAILDVADLEVLRQAIAGLESEFTEPVLEDLSKLRRAIRVPALAPILTRLSTVRRSKAAIEGILDEAISALLGLGDQAASENAEQRRTTLQTYIESERGRAFPMGGFDQAVPPPWQSLDEDIANLDAFVQDRDRVNAEALQIANALEAVMQIPHVAGATEAIDCPVCETVGALTVPRIEEIRVILTGTAQAQRARRDALASLANIQRVLQSAQKIAENATPSAMNASSQERRRTEFTARKMQSVLSAVEADLLSPWLITLRGLLRHKRTLLSASDVTEQLSRQIASNLLDSEAIPSLKEGLSEVRQAYDAFVEICGTYTATASPLIEALRMAVDQQSDIVGWQDVVDLAGRVDGLQTALRESATIQQVQGEFQTALDQIDAARGQILDENFAGLSQLIVEWWERLRPDEPSFLERVARREGAVRTIDFQAGLSARNDRSDTKLRDAIAVFSNSQVQCLGLITFLARAISDRFGFMVLDDPLISSDESHRAPFVHHGLAELIGIPIQVILLTQDQRLARDIGDLYDHAAVDVFHLSLIDVAEGTVVEPHDGSVKAQLAAAGPYTKSNALEMRKTGSEKLRNIVEFVLKRIIVKGEHANGNTVDISTLTGSIEQLLPVAAPFLTDRRHPGQARFLSRTLSPGKHDDEVPTCGDLTTCHGILKDLDKTYL